MPFPQTRLRRLRRTENLRRLVRETHLCVDDLIYPMFVIHGRNKKEEIPSMPGQFRWSVDLLPQAVTEVAQLGIPAVLLFGIPEKKDEEASGAYDENGIVQLAVRAIKREVPELIVITDVCLCEYTSHGHCGVLSKGSKETRKRAGFRSDATFPSPPSAGGEQEGIVEVLNDPTLELLMKTAVSHAEAGADMVAPSDMMDGRVAAIRRALDAKNFEHVPIMSYAAKMASAFYGPFREAAESTPQFGDRRGYQMDYANRREALREVQLDIEEGADIVMVKPALAYLDLIRDVRETFKHPVAAYNVSGEYALVKAAAQNGWIDESRIVLEILTAIKRAGADLILTYWAKDVARRLK
ncbi:MAG: porphobilinogen synthase [Abditibacteriales bacterium]|nr:porphobilinogen synthase [Abditibacteriales bacterium]MDW8366260.1 porphobilinogen synthase [Abditibacteriales bacterium]